MNAMGQKVGTSAVDVWRITTWIAGAFVLLVGLGMVAAHLRHKSSDPWRSPVLLDLKAQLLAEPRNEHLKKEIRQLDLGLRERYFHLLSLKATGVYLLIGGVLMFLYSGSRVRQLKKLPPMPQPDPEATERLIRRARLSRNTVAASGLFALAAFSVLAFTQRRSPLANDELLSELRNQEQRPTAPAYTITTEELRTNWPRFRGYDGSGTCISEISLATQPSVKWRASAPAPGFNSPLIWEKQVFFTGGTAAAREVFSLDADTGTLRWRHQVTTAAPTTTTETPSIPEMTGYAASTAATDGERLYAIFATGEIVALTLEGQPVWSKHLGPLDNPYGHAASLLTWRDQVIVPLDQGSEDSRKSRIIAFNGSTGDMVWQKARLVGASWATPIVTETSGQPQVVAPGMPWVIAYATADGAELWRAKLLEGEVTPSPIFANGLVILVNPGLPQMLALRPDGVGDVTEAHVAWHTDGDIPDITSPVSNGEQVFTLTTDGTVSAFDALTGSFLWKRSVDARGEFEASPSIASAVLLLVSTGGEVIALSTGNECAELWRTQLEDEFHASPAFAAGRIYLRGNNHVWCLGPGETKMAQHD